jgi:hypothetical protein
MPIGGEREPNRIDAGLGSNSAVDLGSGGTGVGLPEEAKEFRQCLKNRSTLKNRSRF